MKKQGFSLIEVVTAVTILALVVGSMLDVFWQGAISAKRSEACAIAYGLAIEKLEDKSAVSPWSPVSELRTAVSGFTGFEREVAITFPYLGFNDLAHIRVTVWWDNGNQSQIFETLKANY